MTHRKKYALLAKIIFFLLVFSVSTVLLTKVSILLGLAVAIMAVKRL